MEMAFFGGPCYFGGPRIPAYIVMMFRLMKTSSGCRVVVQVHVGLPRFGFGLVHGPANYSHTVKESSKRTRSSSRHRWGRRLACYLGFASACAGLITC